MNGDDHLYTKRPVCIRAIQLNKHNVEIIKKHFDDLRVNLRHVVMEDPTPDYVSDKCGEEQPFVNWVIETQEGIMTAKHGDYIIRGVNGEYYPCDPDIFRRSYMPGDHSV